MNSREISTIISCLNTRYGVCILVNFILSSNIFMHQTFNFQPRDLDDNSVKFLYTSFDSFTSWSFTMFKCLLSLNWGVWIDLTGRFCVGNTPGITFFCHSLKEKMFIYILYIKNVYLYIIKNVCLYIIQIKNVYLYIIHIKKCLFVYYTYKKCLFVYYTYKKMFICILYI